MLQTLQILQIFIAAGLTALVLIQSKGGGFASGIGNSISFYRSRRGLEKLVFTFTIVLAAALVANSLALIILS
jgi:protein translocase SecG subunit